MKELSIEEKAKRYDEAFGKARRYYDEYKNRDNILYVEDMEDMFPELKEKESDDEKTRKEITEFFKNYSEHGTWKAISDVTRWIDWLEKQGELVNYLSKGLDNAHDRIDGLIQNNNSLLEQLEKQGEQKPADKVEQKGMNIVEEYMTPFQKKVFCIIDTTIEEEQGLKQVCDELLRLAHDEIKQKTVWNEEDENVVEDIKEAVINTWCGDTQDIILDWLKSLKDRIEG